jgi:uncharacterized membrane protein YiaA
MLVIVWVLLAVLVGAWARQCGRSGVGAFFVALVLSPLVGAIVVALTKPNREAVEAREVASGESKRCPKCAELIRVDAVKCRYCGSEIV